VTRVGRPKAKRTKRREIVFVLMYRREDVVDEKKRREEFAGLSAGQIYMSRAKESRVVRKDSAVQHC